MKLRMVTLTGADDQTNIEELLQLSQEFSFVEWAILFSPKRQGYARYPSWDWVEQLIGRGLKLSAHLCGQWVTQICDGHLTFPQEIIQHFGRVQLNLGSNRVWKLKDSLLWDVLPQFGQEVILGGAFGAESGLPCKLLGEHIQKISILFDASGGRGKLGKVWPTPPVQGNFGYAGGLGPDNVQKELEKITEVAGETTWIDMESKLRNEDDLFDLEKCRRVLEVAKGWVDAVSA